MKKWLSVILAVSLCVGVVCSISLAEEELETVRSGDWEYQVQEDDTLMITMYYGDAEELEIPEELDGKRVTGIGGLWIDCNRTSITIPDSVTNMPGRPFACCWKLASIKVSPDHPTLALIDGVLFSKPDRRLIHYPRTFTETSYVIPQGILVIGDSAFLKCSALESITIPDSVTTIRARAFSQCSGLTSIMIPDSVTGIDESAFEQCTGLTSITIPDNVTDIGSFAFGGCTGLTSITIPDGVTDIGNDAFAACTGLKSVTIPDSVTNIGEWAFRGCDNLTLTVGRDSYAKQYCEENNLNYTYPDALDWLND